MTNTNSAISFTRPLITISGIVTISGAIKFNGLISIQSNCHLTLPEAGKITGNTELTFQPNASITVAGKTFTNNENTDRTITLGVITPESILKPFDNYPDDNIDPDACGVLAAGEHNVIECY